MHFPGLHVTSVLAGKRKFQHVGTLRSNAHLILLTISLFRKQVVITRKEWTFDGVQKTIEKNLPAHKVTTRIAVTHDLQKLQVLQLSDIFRVWHITVVEAFERQSLQGTALTNLHKKKNSAIVACRSPLI